MQTQRPPAPSDTPIPAVGDRATRRVAFIVPLDPATRTVDWDAARPVEVMPDQLLKRAPREASYLPLPAGAMQINAFTRWAKSFDRWLARTQRLELPAPTPPPPDAAAPAALRPKRGGVSVELVAIVWELS